MGVGSPRKHSFTKQMGPRSLGKLHFLKVNGPMLPRGTWLAEANVASSLGIHGWLGQMATSSLRNIVPGGKGPSSLRKHVSLSSQGKLGYLCLVLTFLRNLSLFARWNPISSPYFPDKQNFSWETWAHFVLRKMQVPFSPNKLRKLC
jgi:hypothetical protein